MLVAEGEPAPDFTLTSDSGEPVNLSSFRGGRVVLYFYPKDDTPGCTAQACAIRDAWDRFEGLTVLGVSPDDDGSHAAFKEKHGLPFTLLADTELEVAKAYGVARDDAPFPERSTFLIDEEGRIAAVMRKVDPTTHADDVLARFTSG